jgi:drug/metabolite transporter (DMT)-like permease
MTAGSKNNSGSAYFLLFALAVIWGSSFILMKRGLLLFTPIQIGCLRMFTASLVMIPFAIKNFKSVRPEHWKFLIASGLFGNAIPSILFPLAQTGISSALAGMINTLTPIFTLLIGFLIFGASHAKKNIFGLLIGLAGALLLISGGGRDLQQGTFGASIYVVAATVCYAISMNILRHKLNTLNPLTITSFALLFVGIPMGVAFFFTGLPQQLTPASHVALPVVSIILLGVIGTAVSTVLFNRLIQLSGTLVASSVTYLIPIVATIWGVLDGEHLIWSHFVGLMLILSGVYMINRKP